MRELNVATVKTLCPICGCSYQRPITARELIAGAGHKPVACESCSRADDDIKELTFKIFRV